MSNWKPVPGYKGIYEISTSGEIRSLKGMRKLDWAGRYPKVVLTFQGKRKTELLHRLMYRTFIGDIPKGHHINHIDGNKRNFFLENLEAVTPSKNLEHAYRTGLRSVTVGEKCHRSKLSQREVGLIRELIAGGDGIGKIAKYFKVSQSTISDIKTGRTWRTG